MADEPRAPEDSIAPRRRRVGSIQSKAPEPNPSSEANELVDSSKRLESIESVARSEGSRADQASPPPAQDEPSSSSSPPPRRKLDDSVLGWNEETSGKVWNLTDSSRNALESAEAFRRASRERAITSEHIALGLLDAHGAGGELSQLLEAFLIDVEVFKTQLQTTSAFDRNVGQVRRVAGVTAVRLNELPHLDRNAQAIVDAAFQLARIHHPSKTLVELDDMFGGLLSVPESVAYAVLEDTLSPHIVEFKKFTEAYLRDLAQGVPFPQWLAGYLARAAEADPDLPVGINDDKLDMAKYAHALAMMARATAPPFAVGVFGPWGSGKSSILKMIEERIRRDEAPRERNLFKAYREFTRRSTNRFTNSLGVAALTAGAASGLVVIALLLLDSWALRIPLLVIAFPFALVGGSLFFEAFGAYGSLLMAYGTLFRTRGLGRRNKDRVELLPIWFNAWEHKDSNTLWTRLVEQIYDEMEKRLGFQDYFKYLLTRRLRQIPVLIRSRGTPFLAAIAAASVGVVAWLQVQNTAIGAASGFGGIFTAMAAAVYGFWKPATGMVTEFVRSDYFSQRGGLAAEVKSDLRFLYKAVTKQDLDPEELEEHGVDFKSKVGPKLRIVVLIDDLDRCPPDKAVDILEAIKVILDEPFFVVFLAVDTRMLVKAIEERYKGKLPETAHPNGPGMEYLEKIIQVPFWVPQPSMHAYVRELLTLEEKPGEADKKRVPASSWEGLRAFVRRLRPGGKESSPSPGDAARPAAPPESPPPPVTRASAAAGDSRLSYMRLDAATQIKLTDPEKDKIAGYWPYFSTSPRGVKRIVNLFWLAKSLSYGAGLELKEDTTEKLVKLIVLGERWPDFWLYVYRHVQCPEAQPPPDLQALATEFIAALTAGPTLQQQNGTSSDSRSSEVKSARVAELRLLQQFLSEEPHLTLKDCCDLLDIAVNLPRIGSWDSYREALAGNGRTPAVASTASPPKALDT